VNDRFQRYVDDELEPDARREVEEHCAVCPECASELAGLRRLWADVASAAQPPPRKPLWPGVRARLEERGTSGRPAVAPEGAPVARRAVAWGVSGLALAAGLALGLIVGGTMQPGAAAETPSATIESLWPGSDETALFGAEETTLGGIWLAAAQPEEDGS
jgi:anti-sigma factor RsiW